LLDLDKIKFKDKEFEILETDKGRLPTDVLESYGIYDPNLYKKK